VRPAVISSRLQLAFELVKEPEVGAVGDDLLRRLLDDAELVQTQRIEPDRVLGVIVAPMAVGIILQRLQRIFVVFGEAAAPIVPARWRTDRWPSASRG
jgi:hypothetical protein